MNTATFEDYVVHCAHVPRRTSTYGMDTGNMRAGQVYMNELDTLRPVLAQQVRNADLDPYYIDERIPAFLEFVMNNW
jgi:hypothetical protein